ncbi:conjugal transfer protein TraF [Candidatus Micrarchaeota archaeon]|nr:conjugal transfer protein TraF [Candidatus Micrarchaeota archaeon]
MVEEINKDNYNSKISQPKQLVVVYFTASWCTPCKTFSPIVGEMAQNFKGRITFYKIDVSSTNKSFAKELGVSRIPTVISYTGGKKQRVYVGSSRATFEKWLYEQLRTPVKLAH